MRMDKIEKSKGTGLFTISGKEIYGELTFAGKETSLHLTNREAFDVQDLPGRCIKGTLFDLTKVTLLDCITPGTGHTYGGNEQFYFANIFPHYVLFGDCHIDPNDKVITEVHFVVDDASVLFYDFDAFGFLLDANPYIEQIAHANQIDRYITIGPRPEILYFTGKHEIFTADTVLGRISAYHSPTHSFGGPNGIYLKNKIFTAIVFKEYKAFDETIDHTLTLLRYLEIFIGRPQNLLRMNLNIKSDGKRPNILNVYWSLRPKRKVYDNGERPQPSDVLLDAVRQSSDFSIVLENWLSRHQDWHNARKRFSNSFVQQHSYSIDRLIGSANMFDILPSSAVPPKISLPKEIRDARDSCIGIFKELPPSPERDSILSALGRIGKSALKQKIRHRAKFITEKVGERFPDLFMVIDEAVNCRNHYVHGSEPRFDYSNEFDSVVFFITTLEFVFAASDLIEAGWDIGVWCKSHTTMDHPFGVYRIHYAENLQKLRSLLM